MHCDYSNFNDSPVVVADTTVVGEIPVDVLPCTSSATLFANWDFANVFDDLVIDAS